MAVGVWTDNRTAWYFRALVESSKLASMALNDHNLLTQAGLQWSDPNSDFNDFGVDSNPTHAWLTLGLWDGCPWDRILLAVFVATTGGDDVDLLLERTDAPTNPRTGMIDIFVPAATADHTWVYGSADISGLPSGGYFLRVDYGITALQSGPAMVILMSSKTGFVP